jgi:hypothetical protein
VLVAEPSDEHRLADSCFASNEGEPTAPPVSHSGEPPAERAELVISFEQTTRSAGLGDY